MARSTWDGSSGWFCLDKEGNIYLTDSANFSKNFRIRKFDADGKQLAIGEGKEIAFAARPPAIPGNGGAARVEQRPSGKREHGGGPGACRTRESEWR